MFKVMIIYSDTEDGNKQYVGIWGHPDDATRYATKELKGKKWILMHIFLVAE